MGTDIKAASERVQAVAAGNQRSARSRRLSDLSVGESARVLRLEGPRLFRRRLMELGLVPGTEVEVVNVAPLGDPIELEVRDCRLSIRRDEGEQILVSADKRGLKVLA
ncbi:MAG: FeoA family protein [Myxococcales bacterium]|nr:FeoA family protein [Myxococcales bacterium]MDD9968205.1 FeoA family protein [Myxococcales bacterium]